MHITETLTNNDPNIFIILYVYKMSVYILLLVPKNIFSNLIKSELTSELFEEMVEYFEQIH